MDMSVKYVLVLGLIFVLTGCYSEKVIIKKDYKWKKKYNTLLAQHTKLQSDYDKLKNQNYVNEIKYRKAIKNKAKKISSDGVEYYFVGESYGQQTNGNWYGVISGEVVWGDSLEHYATSVVLTPGGKKISNYRGLFNSKIMKLIKTPEIIP